MRKSVTYHFVDNFLSKFGLINQGSNPFNRVKIDSPVAKSKFFRQNYFINFEPTDGSNKFKAEIKFTPATFVIYKTNPSNFKTLDEPYLDLSKEWIDELLSSFSEAKESIERTLYFNIESLKASKAQLLQNKDSLEHSQILRKSLDKKLNYYSDLLEYATREKGSNIEDERSL